MVTNADSPSSYVADLLTNAHQHLEREILDAVTLSAYPRFELAQIAKSYGVAPELVDQIAQAVVKKQTGHDLEEIRFAQIVQQIQDLELTVKDPGLREWKIQGLAKKYSRSPKQLMEAYNKALCHQQAIKPMSVKEFREQQTQEVSWLIQGWIPKGTTLLLHADGGVGKTLFAYQMMESILTGQPWNGYQVDQGNVLLVQVDEPSLVTAERMDIRGIDDDAPLAIQTEWQVEQMAALEAHIEATKPVFVIVDSLTAINRSCIFSENDTEYARPILQLAAIANKHHCTILIIHHSNADGNSRGTRAIHNSVSEVWGLSVGDGSDRLLRVQKTRLGRPPGRYKFSFDESDFSFRYLGEDLGEATDPDLAATQEERVRLWLSSEERRGVRYSYQEVAEYVGISTHSARRICYDLWAKGLIKRSKPKGERAYLYHVGAVTNLCTDQSDQSDQREVIRVAPLQGMGLKATDQTDQQKSQNLTVENTKNPDQFDHFDQLELDSAQKSSSSLITSIDQSDQPTDQPALIENEPVQTDQLPQVGDLVVANSTAIWYRSGSDKVPWQQVPKQLRQASAIQLTSFGFDLFHELTQPSKVLALSQDRERVKVRNQQTGRTSILKTADVGVLRPANAVSNVVRRD